MKKFKCYDHVRFNKQGFFEGVKGRVVDYKWSEKTSITHDRYLIDYVVELDYTTTKIEFCELDLELSND